MYYQKYILHPIFNDEVPDLYQHGHQTVEPCQNKAGNHTSRSTVKFLKKLESSLSLLVTFHPSPLFCGFGFLKRQLSKHRPKQLLDYGKQKEVVQNSSFNQDCGVST